MLWYTTCYFAITQNLDIPCSASASSWIHQDTVDGVPTGAVRASFGPGSRLADARALAERVVAAFRRDGAAAISHIFVSAGGAATCCAR